MSHTPEPWEANRFTDVNGNQHDSNLAVAETLKHSAMQSESSELFGASQGGLVVFYTGNGPRSKHNAMRAVECVNATRGMADPAKEIAEMKEALTVSGVAIHDARKLIEEKCEVRGHGERYSAREMYSELFDELDATLAKIQTILKI